MRIVFILVNISMRFLRSGGIAGQGGIRLMKQKKGTLLGAD